jgi:hypothetical protein
MIGLLVILFLTLGYLSMQNKREGLETSMPPSIAELIEKKSKAGFQANKIKEPLSASHMFGAPTIKKKKKE